MKDINLICYFVLVDSFSFCTVDILPQRVGSSYIAILVIALILFALVVVAAICYFRFVVIQDPGRRVELLYICILLASCALNYTSVIAWYTVCVYLSFFWTYYHISDSLSHSLLLFYPMLLLSCFFKNKHTFI
jgi:nitrate reductase NapE component